MGLADVFVVVNGMQADGVIGRYALGGAVAATFYLEPVATVDVDVFVTFLPREGSRLLTTQPIFDYLTARGHTIEGEYVVISGWPVQFLPPTGALLEEAMAQAEEIEVEDVSVHVISAEHLAAIALETGRGKDHARLVQFVESGVLRAGVFEAILQRHNLVDTWQAFVRRFLESQP